VSELGYFPFSFLEEPLEFRDLVLFGHEHTPP
jgi:hypothetical protein